MADNELKSSVLGNLIGSGEGGYYSLNRGVAGDSGAQLPRDITVGEIMRLQDLSYNGADKLFAVGRYQMIGPHVEGGKEYEGTIKETVRALGINPNEKFTPELQERMFSDYLINGKRPQVNDYITGKTSGESGLYNAQVALAFEFASVGDPSNGGRSAYDKDSGGNAASITVADAGAALNQMREKYLANKQNGMSDADAYSALRDQSSSQTQTNGAQSRGYLMTGDNGAAVQDLQEKLIKTGITTVNGHDFKPDGIYANDTKAAVEQYQRAHNLTVDGIAGKDTLAALGAAPSNTAPGTATPAQPPESNQAPTPGAPTGNGQIVPPTGFGTWPLQRSHEINIDTVGDPRWGEARGRHHAGIDLKATLGDPVLAYKAGTVDFVSQDDSNAAGWHMQIKHADGTYTMYQHLKDKPSLTEGDVVKEGQKIAEVGASGNASGLPQLHFEFRRGDGGQGTDVNPETAILVKGMDPSPKVKELQENLNKLGFSTGSPDGDFGQKTKDAVMKFQEANGLKPSGIVDGNIFEAIAHPEKYRGQSNTQGQTQPQPTPQSPAPAPSPTPGAGTTLTGTHREGDMNDGVRQIQERLQKMGYPDGVNGKPLAVDGNFGAETRRAVETYQRVNGLESDGIVGPKTLASIIQSTPSQKGLDTQTSPLESLTVPGGQKPETTVPAQSAPTTSGEKLGPATKPGEVKPTEIKPETTAPTTPKAEVKPEPATAGISASLAASEGILMQGSRGADVVKLQEQLAKLGYTDAKGQPVKADGDFGQGTKEALIAFEKSRGMEPNGIVGPKTFEALNKAEQAPQLSNANHPDNAMYKQADALLAKLPNGTFKSEQERNNAAGAVTYEARVSGMTQIDAIIPNKSGNGLIATQGNSQTTGERIVVQKDAAVTQPMEKSTQMIAQDAPAQQTQAAKTAEAPVKTTEQPEAQKKPGIMVA